MKDDAVIKDNEAVYLLNEQTYLHLRENLAGVGYEVFDKNSPLPVEEGQIPREVLGNTQRRMRLSLPPTRTGSTSTTTLFITPLRWTAPGNSGIFCCPGWRCSG